MDLNFKKLGEGPALIILHGLFGSLDNWMSLAKVFSERHTVYLVDQRNHGHSDHADEFNYAAMARDLGEFIKKNAIEVPILIGHSMGGKTVMKFALENPGSWRKLIVVDIAPRAYPVHHQEIIDALNSLDITQIASRGEADTLLSERISDVGQRQFLLKNLARQSGGGFKWKMNLPAIEREIESVGEGFMDHPPVSGEVLFVRGGKSGYISDKDVEEIPALFPDAAIVTVPGAGHWVHAEKPEELIAAVESFIV